jgi:hypothetical protein
MNQISKNDSLDVLQDEIGQKKTFESERKSSSGWDYFTSLGSIGRLPHFSRGMELKEVKRSNRYLAFQEKRIVSAVEQGEIRKAVLVWLCLMKISRSYQLLLFNRVCKGWYWRWSSARVEEVIFGAMNKMRSWDMKLLIHRFYIEKKNGKMRPIGAPNYESRMISKALTDLLYTVTEKSRSAEQHGYMKKRGAWSAILECLSKLKEGYAGYEFDLKSFFNTVEPFIYFRKLEEVDKKLTKVISNVIKGIEYRFTKLLPESELNPKANRKNTLMRTGVPQGLSLSPLLSTWALEYYGRPENLIMYADDGIYFFRHNISKFTRWLERMSRAGIEIAPEKSGSLKPVFKFCGVEIDQTKRLVTYEKQSMSWDNPELEAWLKSIHNLGYTKKEPEWSWTVDRNAFITKRNLNLTWMETLKVYWFRIVEGKMWNGYTVFLTSGWRILDIFGSSSWSCNELLKIIKERKNELESIKAFNLEKAEYEAFSYAPVRKGSYRRHYNNGSPATANKQEYWEIMEFHNLRRQQLRAIIE